MKFIYIDTHHSGISGDMFLASLLGLIKNPNDILDELKKLKENLSGVSKLEIELRKIERSGILANKLEINLKENKQHRTAKSLKTALNGFLEENSFSNSAKSYANKVLDSLVQAEAEVHGKLIEKIHLHELSSVDTLIDILGVTKCLDNLGAFKENIKIYSSKLPLGRGTIKTAHGILPVPAPATSKILENSNLIVSYGPVDGELATPTGVALLTNLNPKFLDFEMNLNKVVYSVGQKRFKDFLNMLRIFYGDSDEFDLISVNHPLQKYLETVYLLETDVDDVSGEIIGNFIDTLQEENILDVKVLNGITKKNRPSYTIRVLCRSNNLYELIQKILDELGTLGVRINSASRICVDRRTEKSKIEINGRSYELRYKISFVEKENQRQIINIKPEFEDLKRVSNKSGLSIKKVQFFAQNQLERLYHKNRTTEE
ncbi:MAG: nickel pincer cofactor biosynthesis protein LarC [Candidatus Hermodarchaeota archaeon]